MQQLSSNPPQANPEVPINENAETLEWASIFGKRHPATTGLTWGYWGGRWGGVVVPDDTITLDASTDNYLVAHRSTGAVSIAGGSPNEWNDLETYGRLYKVTTGASSVTAVEDHRAGPGGIFSASAVPVADLTALLDALAGDDQGSVLVRTASDWVALAPGSAGQMLQSGGAGQDVAWAFPLESIIVAVSDETTPLTTGAAKVTLRMPYAFTLTSVRASLTTAQGSGSILTVDINEGGASILSTKLTIDNSEKTSTTAATAAVISDAALANDAEITIDIDQVGTGGAGLKVYLIGRRA